MSRERDARSAAIDALRARIEKTDDVLLALLQRRMKLARAVGKAKLAAGLPVLDPAREARVVRRVATRARELGMPAEEVRSLFWSIIALCRSEQITSRVASARRTAR